MIHHFHQWRPHRQHRPLRIDQNHPHAIPSSTREDPEQLVTHLVMPMVRARFDEPEIHQSGHAWMGSVRHRILKRTPQMNGFPAVMDHEWFLMMEIAADYHFDPLQPSDVVDYAWTVTVSYQPGRLGYRMLLVVQFLRQA